jgi:hypothetical protein
LLVKETLKYVIDFDRLVPIAYLELIHTIMRLEEFWQDSFEKGTTVERLLLTPEQHTY